MDLAERIAEAIYSRNHVYDPRDDVAREASRKAIICAGYAEIIRAFLETE